MKKMLLKLSSALLVVAVASSCAFAQGQSSSDEAVQTRKFVKPQTTEKAVKEVEAVNEDLNIYRVPSTMKTNNEDAKIEGKSDAPVARPIVSKRSAINSTEVPAPRTRRTTENGSTAVQLPANTVKAQRGFDAAPSTGNPTSTKVNNTVNALPADYKSPTVNGSKSDEK